MGVSVEHAAGLFAWVFAYEQAGSMWYLELIRKPGFSNNPLTPFSKGELGCAYSTDGFRIGS